MKKDYSKNTIINMFGFSLPNFIGYIISFVLSLMISIIFDFKNTFILIGLFVSFIGLPFSGKLLNKYCTNKDLEKCKYCKNKSTCNKNWNCTRGVK